MQSFALSLLVLTFDDTAGFQAVAGGASLDSTQSGKKEKTAQQTLPDGIEKYSGLSVGPFIPC